MEKYTISGIRFFLLVSCVYCLVVSGQVPDAVKFQNQERLQKVPSLVNTGKFEEAVNELNEILPVLEPLALNDPGLKIMIAQGYYLQGVCNLELENYQETIESFNQFINRQPIHPNSSKARLMLAEAHMNLENWSSIPPAVNPMAELASTPPNERETAFQLLAMAYINLEKWEETLPFLEWLYTRAMDAEVRRTAASDLAVSLIRLSRYKDLYQLSPKLALTQANNNIRMNLILLEEGDTFLNADRPDLALLMYRMVVPYNELKRAVETRQLIVADLMGSLEKAPVKDEVIRNRYRQLEFEKTKLDEEASDLEAYPDYDLELRVRLGDVYHELERWEESIQVYLSVYEIDPESEIAERAMFSAFLCAFRADQPLRSWEIAQIYMEKYPGGEYWEDVTLHTANLLINLENWQEAIEVTDKALELAPNHIALDHMLYIKAYALFQESLIRESIQTMQTLLRRFPKSTFAQNAQYWIALGHLFLEEYEQAREGFMGIVKENRGGPVQEDANYRQGVAEYGLGDFPMATQTFTTFLEEYPESGLASEALSMIGDMLAGDSELDSAIEHYKKAVEKSVNMVQADYATFQQARTFELEKRWPEILELFEGYFDQFPDRANFTEATYWKGNALRQLGRREEALQIFFDAVSEYGNDRNAFGVDFILRDLTEELASVNRNSAVALNLRERMQDELQRAADDNLKTLLLRLQVLQYNVSDNQNLKDSLQMTLLREDNFPMASAGVLAEMGRLAEATDQPELKQKTYEYFLETFYDSDFIMDALLGLAEIRIKEKKYGEAIELLSMVTERFPSLPDAAEAYMRLGDVYRLQKEWESAIEAFTLILSVKEWRGELWPTALNRLGDTYREMGKDLEASGFFERVYVLYLGYPIQAAEAYVKRAHTLQEMGETSKAKEVLSEMLDKPELARLPVAEDARAFLMNLP